MTWHKIGVLQNYYISPTYTNDAKHSMVYSSHLSIAGTRIWCVISARAIFEGITAGRPLGDRQALLGKLETESWIKTTTTTTTTTTTLLYKALVIGTQNMCTRFHAKCDKNCRNLKCFQKHSWFNKRITPNKMEITAQFTWKLHVDRLRFIIKKKKYKIRCTCWHCSNYCTSSFST